MRQKVAILIDHYLPGFNYGGPVKTIVNLINAFSDSYDFFILTNNKDFKSSVMYPFINDVWIEKNKYKIMYLSKKQLNIRRIYDLLKNFDVVYTCGIYSKLNRLVIFNRKLRRVKRIFAPMGSFDEGAVNLKKIRKYTYIYLSRLLGVFNDFIWSVSNDLESDRVKHFLGTSAKIVIAQDIPDNVFLDNSSSKIEDSLSLVFISRISPKKNLLFAIKSLKNISCKINFDIYGPIEDTGYWNQCLLAINSLPKNVIVHYKGVLMPQEVAATFSKYNAFYFPTLGENFGHVIFEALSVGCVPIISDKTPWSDIQSYKAGLVCKLDFMEFERAINFLCSMDHIALKIYSYNSKNYAVNSYNSNISSSGYHLLFGNENETD